MYRNRRIRRNGRDAGIHKAFTIIAIGLLCFPSLVVLSLSFEASSDPPTATWTKTYGGPQYDEPFSVIQTSDGGYAIAGYTNSSGAGDFDFWLVKIDSAGVEEWNRTYGGTNEDYGISVIQTSDKGYIIAGTTTSYGAGQEDIWLVKTGSDGSVQWEKTLGGANPDEPNSIVQTSDGGYAIAGYTRSYGPLLANFWLVKTDASGNAQWNKTYGGSNVEVAYSVVQTEDGGYALGGFTFSFGKNGDFWLVKTDASGNAQWNKTYGGINDEYCMSMVHIGGGGYAMAGYTKSSGAGLYDFWLVRTDSSGNELWNKTYGGVDGDLAYSVVQTRDGGYALAGQTYSFGVGIPTNSNLLLVKTDASGNQQWNKTSGGAGDDSAWSLVQTREGGYVVAGATDSFGAGSFDFLLIKLPPTSVEDSTPPVTVDDFDLLTHYREFTITLTATDDLSGVAETYYKINDGAVRSVSADGQPQIVEERADNLLEYWSVDNVGNEETHHLLTGIKLDLSDHTKPTAEAGDNQTVLQGIMVTLNGSGSADNIGIETYSWAFTDVALKTLTGLISSYTFNNTGNFEVTLNVTDFAGNWNTDTTWVNVLADTVSPTAVAGPDQTVNAGEVVHLDGSASSDNVRVTSFVWDFGDQTTGVGATITHTYVAIGDYVVTLTTKDVAGNTATDTLVVTVLPAQEPSQPMDQAFLLIAVGVVLIVAVSVFLILRRGKSSSRK